MIVLVVLVVAAVLVAVFASQRRAASLSPGTDARIRLAVDAGIISQVQADQITALAPSGRTDPGAVPAPAASAPVGGRVTVSPATEVVGYLGAILAMAGVTTLVADSWSELTSGSRIALLAAVATAFLVAGLLVRDDQADDAATRLRSFLLLLSTAAAAGAAGLLADDVLGWSPEGTARLVGATIAAQSALLWARRASRPAQHLTTFGGLVILLVGLVVELDSAGAAGVALWVFAGAWLLGAWRELLPPSEVGLALGGFTMLAACLVVVGSWESVAPLAGLATATSLLAAGAQGRRPALTGAGVVGVLVFTPYTIVYFFGDTIGVPVAFLVVGVLLLALALRHLRHPHPTPADITSALSS